MKKNILLIAFLFIAAISYSQTTGDVRFDGGNLEYYNGSSWVTISTQSSVNPETFGAATLKASATGKYVYSATGGTESKILIDSIGKWFGHQVLSKSNDTIYLEDGGFALLPAQSTTIQLSCSDLTTDLTTGDTKAYVRMPYNMTLTDVRVSLLTPGTSTGITVDITENGTSILSTLLTTDATEPSSTTASVPAVIADANLADDSLIEIDFDGVPTGAKGVIVTLNGNLQ